MPDQTDVLFEFNAPSRVRDFDRTRLTQARLLRAMKKSELASLVGVSSAAIGQYESGVVAPRQDVREKLAKALDVSSEFFSFGRPKVALEEMLPFFRSLRASKVSERQRVMVVASLLWEAVQVLESYVQLPELNLPDCAGNLPSEAAAQLREYWNLPTGPVKHLTRRAESNGIVIAVRSLAELETVDGFSVFVEELPIIIATPRRTDSVFRHRFSIAHELGHLVMHRHEEQLGVSHEREADQFAAAFLTPREMIEPLLPKRVDLAAIMRLSHHWGVSSQSLVYRMRELNLCSDQSAQRAFAKLNHSNRVAEDPLNRYPGETPSLLARAFEMAESVGLSANSLSEGIGISLDETIELLGLDSRRPRLRVFQGGRT